MPKKQLELITTAQACEILGIAQITLRRWIKAGKVTPHKLGNVYIYEKQDIEKLAKARKKESAEN
jgi:excisionase family DNA binding protein